MPTVSRVHAGWKLLYRATACALKPALWSHHDASWTVWRDLWLQDYSNMCRLALSVLPHVPRLCHS